MTSLGVNGAPVIAVVGGGQLARMMAAPAANLGLHLRVLVESPSAPAAQVVVDAPVGAASDRHALAGLVWPAGGRPADVLTFEHEHVPGAVLVDLQAAGLPVRPGPGALRCAQDKLAMRRRLSDLGVATPRWVALPSMPDAAHTSLSQFITECGGHVVVKTSRGGYDGKGVRMVHAATEAADWILAAATGPGLLAEEKVAFTRELAVLVARRPSGQVMAWPVVESVQQAGMCAQVIAPAPGLSRAAHERAQEMAIRIAQDLDVTGILAVELFATGPYDTPELLVNELAMRPHNSGHWTIDGSATSQFEQHLRAVADLPLGPVRSTATWTVMVNVLGPTGCLAGRAGEQGPGALGAGERQPGERGAGGRGLAGRELTDALPRVFAAVPEAKVNLYGKELRPGRKVGHVNVSGDDLDAVVSRAVLAADLLMGGDGDVEPNCKTE